MKNSSLIKVFKTLSKKELKELDNAINSPLFNSQRTVTALYTRLRKYGPAFSSDELNSEELFSYIYPGKIFNAELIRRVISDLKKVIEDYFVYKAAKANAVAAGFIKAEEYLKRELFSEAEKIINNILSLLNSQKISADSLKNLIEIYSLKTKLYFSLNKQQSAFEEMRQQFLLNFYYFFLRNVYNLHDIRVNRIIFNSSIDNELVNKLLNIISYEDISKYLSTMNSKNKFQKISLVYLLGTLNYMNSESTEYYEKLISAASDAMDEFSTEEKYNIYQMLEAIAWYKSTGVNSLQYRKELYRINKMRLADGVFSPDGKYMRLLLYRQILMTALTLKEFDWAEDFAINYSKKLPSEHLENLQNFSFAQISFERKDHEKALKLINKVSFDIFTLKLDSRNLILKIYYELGYFEEAYSLIDSYKHFVSDNKNISEYYRDLISGFLNYYGKLLKLKIDPDVGEIKKFIISIENSSVWHKEWVSEKAEELNNGG